MANNDPVVPKLADEFRPTFSNVIDGVSAERQAPLPAEYNDPTAADPVAYRTRLLAERGSAAGFEDEVGKAIRENREARILGQAVPHDQSKIRELLTASLAANPASDLD